MPSSSTVPVSVLDRLFPELGLIAGVEVAAPVTGSVSNCGCGFRRPNEGTPRRPESGGTGPPASTTTVAPVALKRE